MLPLLSWSVEKDSEATSEPSKGPDGSAAPARARVQGVMAHKASVWLLGQDSFDLLDVRFCES